MSVYLFASLSCYLYVCVYVCQPECLSLSGYLWAWCLSVCLPVYLCPNIYLHPSVYLLSLGCMSVALSISLRAYLSGCLSPTPSICVPVVCLLAWPSLCPSPRLSTHVYICVTPFCLFAYLSVCLSIYPSFNLISVFLSASLSTHLSTLLVHLSVSLMFVFLPVSVYRSVSVSLPDALRVCQSIYLPVTCLFVSVRLSIWLSIC